MAVANIVDIDDFVGRYSLSVSTFQTDTFDDFVTQEQYDLLIDMLGAELYNDFNDNPSATKWTNLLNGVTGYTDIYGCISNWEGLKYLMKPYIFSNFTMFNEKKSVQSGTVKPKFLNADSLSEYDLKTLSYNRWNEFVKRWDECYLYLYSNESDYTDFQIYFRKKINKGIVTKNNIM